MSPEGLSADGKHTVLLCAVIISTDDHFNRSQTRSSCPGVLGVQKKMGRNSALVLIPILTP